MRAKSRGKFLATAAGGGVRPKSRIAAKRIVPANRGTTQKQSPRSEYNSLAMPPRNTVPVREVLTRSHEIREQAAEQMQLTLANKAACQKQQSKSTDLCRHSDELLRQSRVLRERLSKLRHAC